jgi:hypothetical protein
MSRSVENLLKIIPDSIVIECIAIGDVIRQKSWRIGDIVNEIKREILESPRQYADVEIMTIYEAVSVMLNHEYSARTVREYAYLAEKFPPKLRDAYEVLPFSHFRFAATCRDALAVLDLSLARCIDKGHPPTVAWLAVMVLDSSQPILPEIPEGFELESQQREGRSSPDIGTSLGYAVQTFEAVLEQVDLPPVVLSAVRSLWEQIKSLVFQERVRDA